MKKLITTLAALCMAATLTACGGGGGSTAQVASANTTVSMDATNGQAVASSLAGKSFNFASGVADFGTTAATTVTIGASNTFQVASGTDTASGTLSFGSCHFKVTSSTFASGPLVNGNTVTVSSCQLLLLTKGVPADGADHTVQAELVLDGVASLQVAVTVQITSDGRVLVSNIVIGTVVLTPVTGA